MSIRDFHSKFASATPESTLFRALRKLSQVDVRTVVAREGEASLYAWGEWSAT